MARGTRLGTLFFWLAGVGCGSSPTPVSQQGEPVETGQAAPVPEPDPVAPRAEAPVEAAPVEAAPVELPGPAPVDPSAVFPLEAPPSLLEPTCIPPLSAVPPVEAQACSVVTDWGNDRREAARYDPDGRLLELRTNDSVGRLLSVETHVWRNGVELQRRVTYPGGRFDQTDWTYDEQGRLLRRTDQGSRSLVTEYEYNDQGHIGWSTTRDSQGAFVDSSEYSYDAQGHLTEISSGDCDLDLFRCERRSYWPSGQLRHFDWSQGAHLTFSEDYNELGWLIGSTWATGSAGGSSATTRTYDSAGRLDRIQTASSWEYRGADALTTRVYTKGGWRERFAENMIHYPSVSYPDSPEYYSYQRLTQRASFLCDTSTVALQEWDMNGDGIVDARRVHTRDALGRRVREQYSGARGSGYRGLDDGPVRRDFSYDCH